MGNKNASPPKSPDAGSPQKQEVSSQNDTTGSGPDEGPPGPSPELLASLHSLLEHEDHTLLPQSLHQIAESYSLSKDYQGAIQFLQLEKSYHERLLANLAALQENWECQWRERRDTESGSPTETNHIGAKNIEPLTQLCRTHHMPSLGAKKAVGDVMQPETQSKEEQSDDNRKPESLCKKVNVPVAAEPDEGGGGSTSTLEPQAASPHTGQKKEEEEEGDGEGRKEEGGEEEEEEDEVYEEGQEADVEEELCEESPGGTPEEEEVKVEWPTGVPQASAKDLVKLSHTEGSSSPDGLVSILKRRRASLDGLPPPGPLEQKQNPKRKVHFSEPEDGLEQDEVGGDSCLILLLLCLVTVVISVGGTALYCTLVGTYSSICTDFSHNVNFYVMNVRRVFDELRHWLPTRT